MEIKKIEKSEGVRVRFSIEDDGKEVGHASLVLIYNDLHKEPYGIMEDVLVEEAYRGKGYGRELIQSVIEEAKARSCYKLIATSRHSRTEVHEMYTRYGFTDWGREFRMDF